MIISLCYDFKSEYGYHCSIFFNVDVHLKEMSENCWSFRRSVRLISVFSIASRLSCIFACVSEHLPGWACRTRPILPLDWDVKYWPAPPPLLSAASNVGRTDGAELIWPIARVYNDLAASDICSIQWSLEGSSRPCRTVWNDIRQASGLQMAYLVVQERQVYFWASLLNGLFDFVDQQQTSLSVLCLSQLL